MSFNGLRNEQFLELMEVLKSILGRLCLDESTIFLIKRVNNTTSLCCKKDKALVLYIV